MEVTKANLATYLAGLTPSATPYPIEITETVASDWRESYTAGTVGNIINTNTPNGVYLDLGLTVIPNSVTNMYHAFYICTSLTTAPIIPTSVIVMYATFYGCTSLTTAPIIPNSVTSLYYTFIGCTSLITAPVIPNSVTNMEGIFRDCTSLTTAPVIPNSVTSLDYTFRSCTSLTTAPIIPSSVTSLYYAFRDCTALITAPVIPSSVTNMYSTFYGCTSLHTIQNFAVNVDNCIMTDAFKECSALANIYVTTLTESTWHLLHTNTGATGTDYTIYNPDGTVAGSGTVAGTSQVLTLYGKSDELVISANITPTLAKETATSQVQWHKSGLPYDDELMIFNAKNPDTVISNFITVNRAGEEFLGNASTATTATNALACSGNSATATLATQANEIKPLGNSITLTATPTSVTKIIKIATVDYNYSGIFNIRCAGNKIVDNVNVNLNGRPITESGIRVVYGKVNTTYGIKKIVVTVETSDWNSRRQIYVEIFAYANNNSITTLGVIETNHGSFNPFMTEVSSVEGTVVDSLPLNYTRGDISSYQHVFTKNIIGNLTGNATTANKWKTARTITISDADGTNTGTAVSVDGSENETLKLPTTIKANLTGNVTGNSATAKRLLTARKINGVDFDGTADIYDTYSTEEHRIGTWIDGKPLYRKVVNLGALPNSTVKSVPHGISNIGFCKMTAMAVSSTAISMLPFIPVNNLNQGVDIYMSNTAILITAGLDRSGYAGTAILEYTKTTD